MSDRYTLYPASVYFGNTLVDLRQLQSYQFQRNGTKSALTPAGSADRLHIGLANAKPIHRFATRDLESVFNSIGSVAAGIGSDSGDASPSAIWRFQQRACSSDFQASGDNVHINTQTAKGYIKPVSVSGSEDDTDGCLVNLEYHSLSTDGVTVPDTKITTNLTGAPEVAFVSRYFHGPCYYNGIQIEGIDGFNVEFGINATTKLFGNVFPTCYSVETRNPRLTLSGTEANIDAGANAFINNIAGPWTQYLRRGVDKNSRVADNVASHISLVVTSGEWCVDEESYQETGDGNVSVAIEAIDGLVAVGVDVTIP